MVTSVSKNNPKAEALCVGLKNEGSSFGPEECAESNCQSPSEDRRAGLINIWLSLQKCVIIV